MSRNPAIGKNWISKYKGDCYPKDFVTHKGYKMQLPKYYDEQLKKLDEEMLIRLKERRELESQKRDLPSNSELRMKEECINQKITRLKRSYENEES